MKIIDVSKRAMQAIGLMDREIEKRAGVIVMRRLDPRNAKKWHDWCVKYGVPNPVPPEEMHVTIIYSPEKDAKVPLVETTMNISTAGYYTGGLFAMFGKSEEVLVFTFRAYELHDRHWHFLDAGCACDWPSYRPHLSLSYDAAGYELPDEALQDVPAWIILGPEESAEPRPKTGVVEKSDSPRLEVSDDLKSAAVEILKASGEKLNVVDYYDLADIAHGRLSEDVAKRLSDTEWAPEELKKASVKSTRVRKQVEVDYTITVGELPEEIAKKIASSNVAKNNDEQQIVMGIASVSTVNGELVTDHHGDQVTTQALVEFNRSLISGSRAGKFDHEGEVCTEVVAGLVLTEDWQKALGIDLGFEPYLVEIHVPDPVDWAEVKKGDWMLSVAGTMWYYEDAEDA